MPAGRTKDASQGRREVRSTDPPRFGSISRTSQRRPMAPRWSRTDKPRLIWSCSSAAGDSSAAGAQADRSPVRRLAVVLRGCRAWPTKITRLIIVIGYITPSRVETSITIHTVTLRRDARQRTAPWRAGPTLQCAGMSSRSPASMDSRAAPCSLSAGDERSSQQPQHERFSHTTESTMPPLPQHDHQHRRIITNHRPAGRRYRLPPGDLPHRPPTRRSWSARSAILGADSHPLRRLAFPDRLVILPAWTIGKAGPTICHPPAISQRRPPCRDLEPGAGDRRWNTSILSTIRQGDRPSRQTDRTHDSTPLHLAFSCYLFDAEDNSVTQRSLDN